MKSCGLHRICIVQGFAIRAICSTAGEIFTLSMMLEDVRLYVFTYPASEVPDRAYSTLHPSLISSWNYVM
jgi:hypothetical protein